MKNTLVLSIVAFVFITGLAQAKVLPIFNTKISFV